MEEHIVKIFYTRMVTHNVKQFRMEKPPGYSFIPGQATDVSVNKAGFRDEKRPFTFTCLNSDDYLEFTIKIYPERKGVTNELQQIGPGSELIIRDVWGDIRYKGEGVFIAGGAGITPFIAIFRDLKSKNSLKGNKLIFANRTKKDIILESELTDLLGHDFINILSDEKYDGFHNGIITNDFLNTVITPPFKKFYLCGPPPMMDLLIKLLSEMGISEDSIVIEPM